MGIILIIVLILVIFLFWWISVFNAIKTGKLKIEEASSGIDVALTKRFDVLTKLLDILKGYTKHEKETLESIVAMRSKLKTGNATMEERQDIFKESDAIMKSINVTLEQYPDLKASNNFLNLQNAVSDVEEHLQASRRVYNSNVTSYNQKIVTFPSSIVANYMKATKFGYFEAESYKRDDVKMQF